ncbi:MAG: hypothetical protein CVT47_01770 [Thermoplasmata archaeon HGW-Thermoplasmata-2]|nr:MAG: hypothetical protein CVT47_01770 [Thermoplasmata archaeon HGW-Thermoplasmata-2]
MGMRYWTYDWVGGIIAILTFLGATCIFILIAAIPFWLLWNWLMPNIFKLPQINILQAIGLLFLLGIITGSIGIRRNRS